MTSSWFVLSCHIWLCHNWKRFCCIILSNNLISNSKEIVTTINHCKCLHMSQQHICCATGNILQWPLNQNSGKGKMNWFLYNKWPNPIWELNTYTALISKLTEDNSIWFIISGTTLTQSYHQCLVQDEVDIYIYIHIYIYILDAYDIKLYQ